MSEFAPSGRGFRPTKRNSSRQKIDSGDHVLQLFDTVESLSISVARFLHCPEAERQRLLVVATNPNWRGISRALQGRGFDVDEVVASGRLVVHDAGEALARFMRRGKPVRSLFTHTVGAHVADLVRTSPHGLRVYGEMVEVLAQDGNYEGAEQLENLWNELAREWRFTLLCGYAAAHFAGPQGEGALAAICAQHTHSLSHSSDVLSHFLLRTPRQTSHRSAAETSL